MGFWKKAGKASLATAKFTRSAAIVVANFTERCAGEINEIKEKYSNKSNDELIGVVKSPRSSNMEKGVARQILRQRSIVTKTG